MKMSEDTIKKFPKLHYYVRVNMPEVAEMDAIINEIQKLAGTVKKSEIRDALKWGKGPTITVVSGLMCAGVKSYGCFRAGKDELRIDEQMVKDFEAGKGQVKNSKGKRVYLVGATLLHELTHWADAKDGKDNPVEEGDAFERATYGKVLG